MKRIGLFGGSFNPIHVGHVAIGRTMLKELSLDEVWYMVSPQNPLKVNSHLLDEEVRLRLVEMALIGEDGLKACDFEFHLPRPSYTWDTLQSLKVDYPDCEFTLIVGGDNWEHFNRWAHHDEILRDYNIAVFPRKSQSETVSESELPDNVYIVNVPLVNVSSTMLREMLSNGESIKGLVPDSVEEEICYMKLFRCNKTYEK